jgi:hypothetical protein
LWTILRDEIARNSTIGMSEIIREKLSSSSFEARSEEGGEQKKQHFGSFKVLTFDWLKCVGRTSEKNN